MPFSRSEVRIVEEYEDEVGVMGECGGFSSQATKSDVEGEEEVPVEVYSGGLGCTKRLQKMGMRARQRTNEQENIPDGDEVLSVCRWCWCETEWFHDRPESFRIISPCFIREAEEGEEEDTAQWDKPPGSFSSDDEAFVAPPEDGGDLTYAGESEVGVFPADPRGDGVGDSVHPDDEDGERDSKCKVAGGEGHETEIAPGRKGLVGREELVELHATANK